MIIAMKINTKIRYGLRMLLILAETNGIMNTTDLGKKMMVSPKYLRKLAGSLEKFQLITSVQGIHGGYALKKKPEDLTIASLFEAFDERINIVAELINQAKIKCSIGNTVSHCWP